MESAREIIEIRVPRYYSVYGYVEEEDRVQFIKYIEPRMQSLITNNPRYGPYHFIVDRKAKRIVRRPEKESEAFLRFVEEYEKPLPILPPRKEVLTKEPCEKKEEPKVVPWEEDHISLKDYPVEEDLKSIWCQEKNKVKEKEGIYDPNRY